MIAVHDVARINITTKGGETIRIELMSDAAANFFPITKE